jgi:hypothetical protein
VARLVRHAVASSAYQAAFDGAQWLVHEEEEGLAATKRMLQRRRNKPMQVRGRICVCVGVVVGWMVEWSACGARASETRR